MKNSKIELYYKIALISAANLLITGYYSNCEDKSKIHKNIISNVFFTGHGLFSVVNGKRMRSDL